MWLGRVGVWSVGACYTKGCLPYKSIAIIFSIHKHTSILTCAHTPAPVEWDRVSIYNREPAEHTTPQTRKISITLLYECVCTYVLMVPTQKHQLPAYCICIMHHHYLNVQLNVKASVTLM